MIKNIIKEYHLLRVKNVPNNDILIIWINRSIPSERGWCMKGIKVIIVIIRIVMVLKISQKIVYKKY